MPWGGHYGVPPKPKSFGLILYMHTHGAPPLLRWEERCVLSTPSPCLKVGLYPLYEQRIKPFAKGCHHGERFELHQGTFQEAKL